MHVVCVGAGDAGRYAVRELGPIARNTYRNDPATLAAFKSASRVECTPKKAKQAAPPSS